MKQKDLEDILKTVMGEKDIDSMTYREMRESLVAMTGLIVGMLLTTNRDIEEIKKILK